MAYVTKTSSKSAKANFVQTSKGTGVRVSPRKGGVNIGTPTHCESKRSASNLKTAYRQSY